MWVRFLPVSPEARRHGPGALEQTTRRDELGADSHASGVQDNGEIKKIFGDEGDLIFPA